MMDYIRDEFHQVNLFGHTPELFFPLFDFMSVHYHAVSKGMRHQHSFWQFILNVRGSIVIETASEVFPLEPMHFLMIPPDYEHFWRAAAVPAHCLQAFLNPVGVSDYPELMTLFANQRGKKRIRCFPFPSETDSRLCEWFDQVLKGTIRAGALLFHARLLEMLALAAASAAETEKSFPTGNPAGRDSREKIVMLRQLLEADCSRSWQIEELAARAFLSPSRFAHLFREQTGLPPREFINRLRVEKARRMLCFSNLSVGDVAARLGFSSAHYFARIFRRFTGMSPSEFARNKTSKQTQCR